MLKLETQLKNLNVLMERNMRLQDEKIERIQSSSDIIFNTINEQLVEATRQRAKDK